MNNEAFRKLLSSGSVSKSTKEIAREAVEFEFRSKRKRGRDDDYLSDDDYYDDNDDGKSQHHKNEKRMKGKRGGGNVDQEETETQVEDEKKAKKQKYRNRARERREGKTNVDYHDSKDISGVNAEMTKYLGGDEAYTHLVKGLDKALAEKVRREGMSGQSPLSPKHEIDLDQVMDEATRHAKIKATKDLILYKETAENFQVIRPTILSNGILSYIQKVEKRQRKQRHKQGPCHIGTTTTPIQSSLAGQSISRSTMLFSTVANIQDPRCSWELPRETMMSIAQYERLNDGNNNKKISTYTPLDRNLILKLKSVFSSLQKVREETMMGKSEILSGTHINTNVEGASPRASSAKAVEPPKRPHDSDDDIFGDIGDYIPPSVTNKE